MARSLILDILREGGDESRRIHGADNTDLRIAKRLEEVGIPKGDIVLGFQPPHVWPYTEYAVA